MANKNLSVFKHGHITSVAVVKPYMKQCSYTASISIALVCGFFANITHGNELNSGNTLKLPELIASIKNQSPEFLEAKANTEKHEANETAQGFMPAPEAGISWMGSPSAFKNASGEGSAPSYYVRQKIPFPTTWIQRDQSLARISNAARLKQKSVLDSSMIKIEELFWQYHISYEEIKLLEDDLLLIQKHLKDATYRRIRSELSKAHLYQLQEEVAVRKSQIKLAKIEALRILLKIRKLTGIPSTLPSHSTLIKPTLPRLSTHKNLVKRIEEHPDWKFSLADIEAKESLVSLEKSKYMPTLDLTYRLNSKDTPMPGSRQFTLGVTLPFAYFWKTNAEVSKKKAELNIAQAKQLKTRRMLETHMTMLNENLDVLRGLIDDYEKSIIPASKKRLNYLRKLSSSDMETLNQILISSRELLEHRRKLLHIRAEYESSIAHLKHFGVNGEKHDHSI